MDLTSRGVLGNHHATDESFGRELRGESGEPSEASDQQARLLPGSKAASGHETDSQSSSIPYFQRNWNGFEIKSILFDLQYLDRYAKPIFDHYDKAGSGSLSIDDASKLIGHFFFYLRIAPPSEVEIEYLKFLHDRIHDGALDLAKYLAMLKTIALAK